MQLAVYAEQACDASDIQGAEVRLHARHVVVALDKWLKECREVMTSEEQEALIRLHL